MLEFTFEQAPWEQALENMRPGDHISALPWMTLLEAEDEDGVLDALDALEQKGIALDIDDLPDLPAGGELAVRLRQEAQLVAAGSLLTGLALLAAAWKRRWTM